MGDLGLCSWILLGGHLTFARFGTMTYGAWLGHEIMKFG